MKDFFLVLDHEVGDFKRKVPDCFIYLTEVPGRVIRRLVAPHGASVIKAEREASSKIKSILCTPLSSSATEKV